MSGIELIARGGEQIKRRLEAEHQRVIRRGDQGARASANVFRKQLRAALPKGKTGRLRKGVRVARLEPGLYRVKVGGREAHLVLGDTKEHEITPRAMKVMTYPGAAHPFARALHPAHRGDHELISRVRAQSSAEATAAAHEVLRNG